MLLYLQIVEDLFEGLVEAFVKVVITFRQLPANAQNLLPADLRQRRNLLEDLADGRSIHIFENLLHKQIIVG